MLTGQTIDRKLYDHVNSYTGESGSDGVVRVASANLNATLVRLRQEKPRQNDDTGQWAAPALLPESIARGPQSALAVLPGLAHSGEEKGILRSVRATGEHPTVAAVKRCLAVRTAAEAIDRNGRHLLSVVNDIGDLSRIEAGKLDVCRAPCSLIETLRQAVSLAAAGGNRRGVTPQLSFATPFPSLASTDPTRLRQIVLNLVSNAIKFTDAGGQVIVSTAMTDRGEVAFRVRDTGIGMTPEEVEAALEPFRQLATSRRRGGTGLGLPLTKALVEANRGALQIASQPREGTLVEVIFPPTRVLAE